MQHSVEDLIKRINVMKDKAIELHRLRNQFSNLTDKKYDHTACTAILALSIAMDKDGNKIKTEMEYNDS
jgi:hypothetical protein